MTLRSISLLRTIWSNSGPLPKGKGHINYFAFCLGGQKEMELVGQKTKFTFSFTRNENRIWDLVKKQSSHFLSREMKIASGIWFLKLAHSGSSDCTSSVVSGSCQFESHPPSQVVRCCRTLASRVKHGHPAVSQGHQGRVVDAVHKGQTSDPTLEPGLSTFNI